jgi:hypothetical protein
MKDAIKIFSIVIVILIAGLAIEDTIKRLIQDAINNDNEKQKLVSFLKIHTAYDDNGRLKLIRHGRDYDGGYVVPVKALEQADALLGYGIADDNSFEEKFSDIYNKPSYGFDCGITNINSQNPLFKFVNQCIASDKTLYSGKKSSGNISSFTKQIDDLGLTNKKLFIKMDIEGSEYEAFTDILPHHQQITGIVLEIHFRNHSNTQKAVKLLSNLSKEFVLLHVHANNCCNDPGFTTVNAAGTLSDVIELTYINKALINEYELSDNQSHPTAMDMPNNREKADIEFEVLDR